MKFAKRRKITKAFEKVAHQNQTSVEEVNEEITKAMKIAMTSENPESQKLWTQIAPDGKTLAPEELVRRILTLLI